MSQHPVTQPPELKPQRYKTWTAISGEADDTPQTLFEHLNELRSRLFRAILALVIGVLASAVFTSSILKYLIKPYGSELKVLGPTESVVMYFRVALLAGAILAIPYITLQLFMFIAPGLNRKEKRWIYMALPATTGLFLVGVAFAWFIMVPSALGFLRDFESGIFEADWTAERYIAFITSLLFWIGVAFEMPVVVFVLARLGILGPRPLLHNWRFAVVLITIAAALITPTVDPFNMLLVIAPLLGLYIVSIGLAALAYPRSLRN
ncbi:MAG TPA: twin-arginine translocase subunit TatC [Aggregatilinea sp.]|jgi:sec-independent protein translocase protein TatC|uniref:twin-arginine translocase subunit TatC n=1 Tax=Aggregatilinea sp. TaxID=2806333 RepID=UPI002B91E8E3|nr:twin-arginine translocase subunit TatC [Aggregatilinea sp.]HML22166.1 twin-arginine translocase subunit TatC [Aggregatilinea sp.]